MNLFEIALLVLIVGVFAYDYLQPEEPEPHSIEAIHTAYRDGEIDEAELERRLELAVDPRVEEIQAAVEPVNGVGPSTSLEIAREFESVQELAQASETELQEVSGVGEQRAQAIVERLN